MADENRRRCKYASEEERKAAQKRQQAESAKKRKARIRQEELEKAMEIVARIGPKKQSGQHLTVLESQQWAWAVDIERTHNPELKLETFAEIVVAELERGKLSRDKSEKDWDVKLPNGELIQVKSSVRASAKFGFTYWLKTKTFDYAYFIEIERFTLIFKTVLKIPFEVLQENKDAFVPFNNNAGEDGAGYFGKSCLNKFKTDARVIDMTEQAAPIVEMFHHVSGPMFKDIAANLTETKADMTELIGEIELVLEEMDNGQSDRETISCCQEPQHTDCTATHEDGGGQQPESETEIHSQPDHVPDNRLSENYFVNGNLPAD